MTVILTSFMSTNGPFRVVRTWNQSKRQPAGDIRSLDDSHFEEDDDSTTPPHITNFKDCQGCVAHISESQVLKENFEAIIPSMEIKVDVKQQVH